MVVPRHLAPVAIGAIALLATATAVVAGPLLGIGVLCAAAAAAALWASDPAWTFSLALAAYVFTGHADLIGFPADPARLLLLFGLARLASEARLVRRGERRPNDVWQEWWMLAAFAWVIGSAAAAQTLFRTETIFFLFDQYGLVPFAIFLVAGRVFSTKQQRDILFRVLIAVSAYLAVIGVLEGLELFSVIVPSYIGDPALGIHFGRARGPFLASVPMGLALCTGIVVGLVWLHEGSRKRARAAAIGLVVLSGVALIFTLTRGAWIAGAASTLVCLACLPRFRRFIPAVSLGTAVLVVGFLTVAPSVNDKVSARADDLNPVWERQNTLAAALRVLPEKPVFGLGFGRWVPDGNSYLELPDDIPLRGYDVPVHNVILLNLAELGIVGAAIWFTAIAICLLLPLLRRGPPDLTAWRALSAGLFVATLISGAFAPQVGPYSTVVMWTIGGIVARAPFRNSTGEPSLTTVADSGAGR